jgi:DNA-binding protein HU-beta
MGEVRLAPKKANKNKHLPVSASARFRPGRADLIQSERLSQNTNEEFESLFFLNMLVESVAAQTRMTKKAAAEMMDVVFNTIGEAVKKDARFSYPGFGTWSLRTRKERHIRNPSTNEIMKLKSMTTIGFRPAKELKETL